MLAPAFPDRMTPAPALDKLVAAGRLGQEERARLLPPPRPASAEPDPRLRRAARAERASARAPSREALSERMVLAMINEAVRCLEDGVVADAGMLDLAMIFGAGFPPFRGGLLRHADTLGLAKVEARLTALRAEKGERFEPAALLTRLAARGRRRSPTADAVAGAPAPDDPRRHAGIDRSSTPRGLTAPGSAPDNPETPGAPGSSGLLAFASADVPVASMHVRTGVRRPATLRGLSMSRYPVRRAARLARAPRRAHPAEGRTGAS